MCDRGEIERKREKEGDGEEEEEKNGATSHPSVQDSMRVKCARWVLRTSLGHSRLEKDMPTHLPLFSACMCVCVDKETFNYITEQDARALRRLTQRTHPARRVSSDRVASRLCSRSHFPLPLLPPPYLFSLLPLLGAIFLPLCLLRLEGFADSRAV